MKYVMDLFASIVCGFLTINFIQSKVIIIEMDLMDIAKLMAFVWCSMRLGNIVLKKTINFIVDTIDLIGETIEELK